jgi:hypothetical protein
LDVARCAPITAAAMTRGILLFLGGDPGHAPVRY